MASEESTARTGLHPRNLHRQRYDFVALSAANQELASFVRMSPAGEATIDFADPEAVKALNRSLLMLHYGIKLWDIPKGYLCPPIPSRADYIHHVADLFAESNGGIIPEGKRVRVLDIGVGANCIFPIIGRHVHGWQFVGADIDPLSVTTAQQIVKFNPSLKGAVEIRLQPSKTDIFRNIWLENERFDLTLCNPPFHSSQADADAKTQRKLRNLGQQSGETPTRNFGGKNAELFVDGGELAFVRRIVDQSIPFAKNCLWFTTFVSKAENLKPIHMALERAGAADVRTLESRHGQKSNRIVCWTFLNAAARQAWAKAR